MFLLLSYAPDSSGGPTLGADVKMTAYSNSVIVASPEQPRNFLKVTDLKPGAPAVHGTLVLRSTSTEPKNVSLGIDQLTTNNIPNIPFAQALTMSFGDNGELGTTTLATMATTPLAPFEIAPGELKRVAIEVSLPLTAGEQAGGQEAPIALVPEVTP